MEVIYLIRVTICYFIVFTHFIKFESNIVLQIGWTTNLYTIKINYV